MEPSTKDFADYTVILICTLSTELAPARALLDKIHPPLPQNSDNNPIYTLGRMKSHNIVLACVRPAPSEKMDNAITKAGGILSDFPSVRFCLMMGVGRGVPSLANDIRRGDLMVEDQG